MKLSKKNLLIITGTRAEYGLFRSTILKLKKSKQFNVKLLVTGMHTLKHYGSTINEIKKDFHVDCVVPIKEYDDMPVALSKEITGVNGYVAKNHIAAILVIGDRDEPFAAAIVGVHRNIPVIHVSGGDFSGPTVDHYLRNAITVFSRLHLVQTQRSKTNVIALGADPKHVHIVGSAGLDGLKGAALFERAEIARQLKLNAKAKWILAVQHPTPFEEVSFTRQIASVVAALKRQSGEKIIVYPNADTGSGVFFSALQKLEGKKGFHLFKNLNHKLFLSLVCRCDVFIGNSSSGLVEAGFLKTPFVLVGSRQKGREAGDNVISVDYQPQQIVKAMTWALSTSFQRKLAASQPVYQGGDVSGKIVKKIEDFFKLI